MLCVCVGDVMDVVRRYFSASLVAPLPNPEQTNLPSSNHTYTKSTPNHIHHHYAPSATPTHTISSTAPTYALHYHPWICGQTDPAGVMELLARWRDKLAGGPKAG